METGRSTELGFTNFLYGWRRSQVNAIERVKWGNGYDEMLTATTYNRMLWMMILSTPSTSSTRDLNLLWNFDRCNRCATRAVPLLSANSSN
jgi:hypothetical protein